MSFMTFMVFIVAVCLGHLGVDIPTPDIITIPQVKCLVSHGYDMIFIRAYRSYGTVDPNVLINIENAIQGGIKDIDVYIFPCVPCGNPRKQAQDTVNHLKGQPYNHIWVDIEERAWSTNKTYNQWFTMEMTDELLKLNQKIGIYASAYQWEKIVGKEWEGCKDLILWWPRWNHIPSFDDYVPFGGWKKPYAKQYEPDAELCGLDGWDLDYKP